MLDGRKLDFKEMSDNELNKNQGRGYSVRCFETAGDKEMARKAM